MVGGLEVLLGLIARSLLLESARVLHESLPMPALTYGSETMIWRIMTV